MWTPPQKLSLARLPTPLERLDRLSDELKVGLWIKRDDLTGSALTGNKIRKLEFVLANAREVGATSVITGGGLQSNHARATAIAARKLGLEPYLMLRTPDGTETPPHTGNRLLDQIAGATVRTITPDEWKERDALMAEWAEQLESSGKEKKAYVIPEGASNARGALGYVSMVAELNAQINEIGFPNDVIYLAHACGSGGTTLGLAIGAALYCDRARAVGFAVCDDEQYFRTKIDALADDFANEFGGISGAGEIDYDLHDQYKGIGYALSQPRELQLISEVAQKEAIFLDPVYTGKAFGGLLAEIEKGTYPRGAQVIFVHTGGIYGLFAQAAELDAALS